MENTDNVSNKPVYIFEIDGVIADITHRLGMLGHKPVDWQKFLHSACDDNYFMPMVRMMRHIYDGGGEIWLWTNRCESIKDITVQWLAKHPMIPEHIDLWMRPLGEKCPDQVLKSRRYTELSEHDKRRIVLAIEERPRVIQMWNVHGVPCLNVNRW